MTSNLSRLSAIILRIAVVVLMGVAMPSCQSTRTPTELVAELRQVSSGSLVERAERPELTPVEQGEQAAEYESESHKAISGDEPRDAFASDTSETRTGVPSASSASEPGVNALKHIVTMTPLSAPTPKAADTPPPEHTEKSEEFFVESPDSSSTSNPTLPGDDEEAFTPVEQLEYDGFTLILSGRLSDAQAKLEEALALLETTAHPKGEDIIEPMVRSLRFAVMSDSGTLSPRERAEALAYLRDTLPVLHNAGSWRHVAMSYYTLAQIMSAKKTLYRQALEGYRRAIATYDEHLVEDIIKARAYFFMGFMLTGRVPPGQVALALEGAAAIASRLHTNEARRLESRALRMLDDLRQ